MHVYWIGVMETTESKVIPSLSGYMYFADISTVNLGVHEAYAHVYHLVISIKLFSCVKGHQDDCECVPFRNEPACGCKLSIL